jgi:hypothetical protein
MRSFSNQTARFESYVILIAEGENLRILRKSYENAMNNVEKINFDKVSNVSNWVCFNYVDGITINFRQRANRM